MIHPDCTRTLIIGNGGAGKSWLAAALAQALDRPWTELDTIRWEPGFGGVAREVSLVTGEVSDIAAEPSWIIEGAYGWLASIAAPRATALIWLDLPVAQCVANIEGRKRRSGETEAAVTETMAWAASYLERRNNSSFAAHSAIFEAHPGDKWRLRERAQVETFLYQARANPT